MGVSKCPRSTLYPEVPYDCAKDGSRQGLGRIPRGREHGTRNAKGLARYQRKQAAGWSSDGGGETVGLRSGRRIVEIKNTSKADLTENDYAHMNKVVGYVHRHLAQGGPKQDVEHSAWRHSLMNWGHDPLKD